MTEVAILALLTVMGILLARDTFRLRRWSPDLFRGGLVVFRKSIALVHMPEKLPTPHVNTGFLYRAHYRLLGPGEVAFTAQTFNAPLLLGRLEVCAAAPVLSATGRLYWGLWSVFLVGFPFIGFPWPALAFMYVLFAFNYVTEVRAFHRVAERVADAINEAAA